PNLLKGLAARVVAFEEEELSQRLNGVKALPARLVHFEELLACEGGPVVVAGVRRLEVFHDPSRHLQVPLFSRVPVQEREDVSDGVVFVALARRRDRATAAEKRVDDVVGRLEGALPRL